MSRFIVKDVPGYEDTIIDDEDVGGLVGMLTDTPDIVKKARKWVNSNLPEIEPILNSKQFRDMYGGYYNPLSAFDQASDSEQIYYYRKAYQQLQGKPHTDDDADELAEELYDKDHSENTVDLGPTGIANPADYMSSVTETEEDTNGDGNIDKVTIEKETE